MAKSEKPKKAVSHVDAEKLEDKKMVSSLRNADKEEAKAWGIGTDSTSFGKKKIDIPNRWY
ncbi:MAG: hypothetical protein JKX97_08975 [Candidatus Lindowbacteria bacterium]|nr:hypothetical protein [Candidatus Lindowbacteria bacterium]